MLFHKKNGLWKEYNLNRELVKEYYMNEGKINPNYPVLIYYQSDELNIEYNFDIPLLLSLDFRPEFGFSDYDVIDDFAPDIAVGVRYQF